MSNTLISKMDKNILTNVEGPMFVNYKDPSKPVLKSMMFYGYFIRYFDFEYGQMFVVADLISQYCKINNKGRINFTDYLRLSTTSVIIKELTAEVNSGNPLLNDNLQNTSRKFDVCGII